MKEHFAEGASPALLSLFSLVLLLQDHTRCRLSIYLKARARLPVAGRKRLVFELSFSLVFPSVFEAAAACGSRAVAVFEMADSNPASPLACLLDLTYRSAEAESNVGVVSALKKKVSGCSKCLLRGKRSEKRRFTSEGLIFLNVFDRKRETCRPTELGFASRRRPPLGNVRAFFRAAGHKYNIVVRLVKKSGRNRSRK